MRAWWVAPNYPMSNVGWRPLKGLASQIPGTLKREMDRTLHYPGGGWVQVKSADKPEGLRGEGLDLVVVDETAHIPKFEEVWEQSLRPALSDRQGKALFISTPRGFNHFWELYNRAQTETGWAAFQHPTWDNPYIEASEIEAAREQLPALVFRQEYGAEFVQLAGALFRREWFQLWETAPEIPYARYWDLATSTKEMASYTAGVKAGFTEDGTLVVADVVRGRWEWPDALHVIGTTARADGASVRQGVEDVGAQKGMYQALMREPALRGVGFWPVTVHKDKLSRALPVLARAEQRKVALVMGEWNGGFLDEVCAFPESDNDDQVDGLSGAAEMLTRKGFIIARMGSDRDEPEEQPDQERFGDWESPPTKKRREPKRRTPWKQMGRL